VRIGWIGSPSTTKYLDVVAPAISELAEQTPIVLMTMGASEIEPKSFDVKQYPWQESQETQFVADIDIGIMPLEDTDWERGKCGYKLIQYMACGKPVIASPVGVNKQIVSPELGFLCEDTSEWKAALSTLINDAKMRGEMGASGRLKVEQCYNTDVVFAQLSKQIPPT
jgi:glycosyltransferase involved in cell wall biosynthesis